MKPEGALRADPDAHADMALLARRIAEALHEAQTTSSALDRARALYRERRLRERHFPTRLCAGPMWNMLLDLFIADAERRAITVSSLCVAAAAPATTALRHLARLADHKLIERAPHPRDARSTVVRLSEDARAAMLAYLEALD